MSREVKGVVAALLVLLLLKGAHVADLLPGFLSAWNDGLVSTLSNRGLNREAREALTSGYYEGLLNEGSRLSTMNRFVLDNRRPSWEDNSRPESRPTGDFLYYEHIPDASTPDYRDQRFRYMLTTNSAGMADQDYPLVKPERSRRIALLGDSLTRGLGAPPGGNYESFLEHQLNDAYTTEHVSQYEILNFAVSGYHITQLLEAAKVKATPYDPDLFLVALSDLSVYRRWHGHIAALLYSGIDLKYQYLRDLVADARITADDPIGLIDARLARERLPTIRWVINELQAHAAEHEASLMVVLVPSTEDPDTLEESFLGLREMLFEEGVDYIDLLDAFADQSDMLASRVADGDRHPNAYGHRLLFERLYERLLEDRHLLESLTGVSVEQHDLP